MNGIYCSQIHNLALQVPFYVIHIIVCSLSLFFSLFRIQNVDMRQANSNGNMNLHMPLSSGEEVKAHGITVRCNCEAIRFLKHRIVAVATQVTLTVIWHCADDSM